MWLPDTKGNVMKQQMVSSVPALHPDSDLQVQDLLIRRGLSLEIGSVMSYKAHDKLNMMLMTALTYPAPLGYTKIGYMQIKEADAMFWELLAQRSREGIRTRVSNGCFLGRGG